MTEKIRFHPGRSAAIVAVCVCLVFFNIYSLILKTGLIPGADPKTDAITIAIQDAEARRITVEGQILDRNDDPITEPGARGKSARVLFDESYSSIIGYNSPIYETSGLRNRLYKHLFYGGEDGVGAEVRLTTDNTLQEFCYHQLGEAEGSVIIMNAATGELLACASRSSAEMGYNVNEIDKRIDTNGDGVIDDSDEVIRMYDLYSQYDAFFLNRAVTAEDPPGSTFKIITSFSLIENGMKNYVYDDLDGIYEIGGKKIRNAGDAFYGAKVDMEKALNDSVNVYFASGAVQLGSKALLESAEKFLLTTMIELDFATLKPHFSLGSMADKVLLADTAYGQGNTRMAPLHIAMVMGAVVNDGEMMTPYLIDTITDDGEVREKGKSKVASTVMDKETASQLKDMLHSTAVGYELTEDAYGIVYAKTGTAETGNKNHIYMLVGIEDTSLGDLVVLVDKAHVDESSAVLKPIMKNILGYLVAM